MSSGYGGGNYFSLRKSLFQEVGKTKSNLNEQFSEIFNQLTYFQTYLGTQRGMAVTALKSNLQDHMEFLSKSAPTILYFLDTTEAILYTLESTDVGDNDVRQPTKRHQWTYQFSEERALDEINIVSFSLTQEAKALKSNFERISEILSGFTGTIDNIMDGTTIPWGEFSSIWSEAKHVCANIMEETDDQVTTLITKTDVLIEEMNRLDRYLAFSNLA